MNANTWEDAFLVLLGWVLSAASGLLVYGVSQRRQKRKLFTRVFRTCADVVISLELAPAWRAAGLIETVAGLLDLDESWLQRLPPSPPALPQDLDEVCAELSEWEGARSGSNISTQMQHLKTQLTLLHQVYGGLVAQARDGHAPISQRGVQFVQGELPKVRQTCQRIMEMIEPMRLSFHRRIRWGMMHRFARTRRAV